jgi:hypothetical protein
MSIKKASTWEAFFGAFRQYAVCELKKLLGALEK